MDWRLVMAVACGLLVAESAGAMAPDVSKRARQTAEDAGCKVASLKEEGVVGGLLTFTVACEAAAPSERGVVACGAGACEFRAVDAISAEN